MPEENEYTIRKSLVEKEAAEARLADAHAQKFLAEAREHNALAEQEEIKLEMARRDEEKRKASDEFHFMYQFNGTVDASSVKSCMNQLSIWTRKNEKCTIELVFHSPGGDVINGMALFDYLRYLQSQGHTINTLALGMAASMAGILLQAGDRRTMGRETWVLIHQGSFGAGGSVGQVEDQVEWVKRIQTRILNIFAQRSTLTAKQIAKKWERKDWWLSSDDCLTLGFVDEIR